MQPKASYQDYLAWTYFGEDALDKEEFDRLADLLQGIDRFIDVGASHGVYTYHASRILEGADIFAIEADPDRFEVLKKNISKWAADTSNRIHPVHAAASDEEERRVSREATFYKTGTQISGGLFSVPERSDQYSPCKVELVTLDDFLEREARTFVKIDVEGAELRVLKGASGHITEGNTIFLTEISWWGDRPRGTSAFDVLSFCFRSGLRVDRRLRSDYLLSPEPSRFRRAWSILSCLGSALLIRAIWNRLVPRRVRTWRERRENRRRLSRYFGAEPGNNPQREKGQGSPRS